jgi:DNA-binding SARP family transcriptional activator
MRLYLETGQLALAARQYQTCCQILEKELNITPMPETQALYTQIATGDQSRSLSGASNQLTNLQQALQQLQQAKRNFDEAHKKLQHATQLVESMIAGYQEMGR